MKLIITEAQLKEVIGILAEAYTNDPYFADNDIYDYEPNQSEIDDFNKVDKPQYSNFKGFENPKDANRFDPNKNFGKPIQFKREKEPSGKNYTGKAKVIYTYPNGIQVDVKNSEGPVAVVQQKLSRIKSQSTKDAPFYSIKSETL